MDWTVFIVTISFMVIGYLIGSWSNAIMITKFLGLKDVREQGSGNAGATNTLRSYGKKIGAIVFFLDFMKTVVVCLLAFSVKEFVIIPLVGFAVVVGHVYPIFFDFKGGKGAACLFGLFLSINWVIALIGVVVFLLLLKVTKTVSIGSLLVPILLIIIFAATVAPVTELAHQWAMPILAGSRWYISFIALIAAHALVIFKHRENIRRLLQGDENSF